jgi:hypothetical protein
MAATNVAAHSTPAECPSPRSSPPHAVGTLALGGLIAFAVAALLDGTVKLPKRKV